MQSFADWHVGASPERQATPVEGKTAPVWPNRILFASDGSAHAARAGDMLAALVPSGATVRVVTVAGLEFVPYGGEWGPLSDEPERQARLKAIVETAFGQPLQSLRFAGCTLEKKTRLGNPAEQIMDEIREWQPDLVVVGRTGLGGMVRLLLGSVSEHLIKHSHVPVLVVP